jgi:hypothetical protein
MQFADDEQRDCDNRRQHGEAGSQAEGQALPGLSDAILTKLAADRLRVYSVLGL